MLVLEPIFDSKCRGQGVSARNLAGMPVLNMDLLTGCSQSLGRVEQNFFADVLSTRFASFPLQELTRSRECKERSSDLVQLFASQL
jgi:hypothetical protein